MTARLEAISRSPRPMTGVGAPCARGEATAARGCSSWRSRWAPRRGVGVRGRGPG